MLTRYFQPIFKFDFLFQESFFCQKQQASDPLQLCCPLEGIQPQIEEKPTLPDKNECGTQTGDPASCTLYNKVSILGVASLLGLLHGFSGRFVLETSSLKNSL